MSECDVEQGSVNKTDYDAAVYQAGQLGNEVRKQNKEKRSLSRGIDVLRQIVLVGTCVVIILLVILAMVDHPSMDFSHKHFAVGGLVSICSGFAISLWLSKGSPVVLMMLVVMGIGAFMFSLGYVISEIRHLKG